MSKRTTASLQQRHRHSQLLDYWMGENEEVGL